MSPIGCSCRLPLRKGHLRPRLRPPPRHFAPGPPPWVFSFTQPRPSAPKKILQNSVLRKGVDRCAVAID